MSSALEFLASETKMYVVDTSLKVGYFSGLMGGMELALGMSAPQILQTRLTSALTDVGVARFYTKATDKVAGKLGVDMTQRSWKAWALDTTMLVGTYTPIYGANLYAAGADSKQIAGSLILGAAVAAVATPVFRKLLTKWRSYWHTNPEELIYERTKAEETQFQDPSDLTLPKNPPHVPLSASRKVTCSSISTGH